MLDAVEKLHQAIIYQILVDRGLLVHEVPDQIQITLSLSHLVRVRLRFALRGWMIVFVVCRIT
jgi:hypothetical protein